MNLADALEKLKAGERIHRRGWNGQEMFLFYVPAEEIVVSKPPLIKFYSEGTLINQQPFVMMKTAQNTLVPWLASQSDMLATDWDIIEDKIF